MAGIGERLTRLGEPPELNFLLINPGVKLPTAKVFAALEHKNNLPMPTALPQLKSAEHWVAWLESQRNDLEAPAITLQPIIGEVLKVLRAYSGVRLSRMSGSGATCFALFASDKDAQRAEAYFQEKQPNWWVKAAKTWTGKDQVSRSTT